MPALEKFGEYFSAVHGCDPFPWQTRLLRSVYENSVWPAVLSLPTGAGKTAILDISLYALACGAQVPRCTVLVVDRRIVVDEAYHRARRIVECLSVDSTGNPVLDEVRDALLRLGGTSPVTCALMRGGIYREDTWVRDPLQPAFLCSTVDQVGSRLLHQGYGVSPNSRSIHAGLLANDALIVLDEAHTSEPFRQTLAWIEKFRRIGTSPLSSPFAVVTMTATPRTTDAVFRVDETDRNHSVLSPRLNCKKNLALKTAEKPKDKGLVSALVESALGCAQPGKTVLVVANRVRTARDVAEELDRRRAAKKSRLTIEEPLLLTGRVRPVERDGLLEVHRDPERNRLFSGRNRAHFQDEPALVVVATQCVEVGVDLDADALVTEVCPLDSLRQRLGRLNRLGGVQAATEAVVVAPQEIAGREWRDPVYGDTPRAVWQWLQSKQTPETPVDGGVSGWENLLDGIDQEELRALCVAAPDAPVMFPAYCDIWVQTSPVPAVVPDPSIFLHGPQRGAPEVRIVWRADLPEENAEVWADIVAECPPVMGEALSVPIYQARQWLLGAKEADSGSDLEGEPGLEDIARGAPSCRHFLRWLGTDDSEVCDSPDRLRPGDTIVLPCSAGGCDKWGWAPGNTDRLVTDIADEARFRAGRTPVLRIHESCLEGLPDSFAAIPREQSDANRERIRELVQAALTKANHGGVRSLWSGAIVALRKSFRVSAHPSGRGWILRGRLSALGEGFTGDDDAASGCTKFVSLSEHLEDVRRLTHTFAKVLGIPAGIARDMAAAARLHDAGKADPRLQALLHRGNRLRAEQAGLLAKSDGVPLTAAERRIARVKSGYPEGGRHELLSVRLAETSGLLSGKDIDRDLVLHLIASHHGRCRAFAPVITDPSPRPVTVEIDGERLTACSDGIVDGKGLEHMAGGVPERFWNLIRTYGWWGLSYIEAILRLADWRASSDEGEGDTR